MKRVLAAAALALLCAGMLGGAGLYWRRLTAELSSEHELQIADVSSERLTRLGSVVGIAAPNDAHAWLGIPYARPPVDALRWRAPVRPEPWTDTLDALGRGPVCARRLRVEGEPLGELIGQEDCLRLDVWSPRFESRAVPAAGERMPVIVFVHEGGARVGAPGGPIDGSMLAVRGRLLVVSPSHRLGPFGWFAHPALAATASTAEDRSGNFGTLDLIAALRWVQENAEFFGGDPGNVTLVGQGSGGRQVMSLLRSPLARGLFRRAIVQSGSEESVSMSSASQLVDAEQPGQIESASEIALRLLIGDGSASDRASALDFIRGLGEQDVAGYLRAKSGESLLAAYGESGLDRLPMVIRDGFVLPLEPMYGQVGGGERPKAVPIILGSNRDEMKLFLSQEPEHVSRRFGLVFRLRDRERYERLAYWHSSMRRAVSVDGPATRMREAEAGEVFAYRFDWDEEPVFMGADFAEIVGAARGMELPFVLGRFEWTDPLLSRLLFSDANHAGRASLQDAMMSYWTEFAYSGSPGRGRDGSLPEWRPWARGQGDAGEGAAAETFLALDTRAGGGIRMSTDSLTLVEVLRDMRAASLTVDERCDVLHRSTLGAAAWSPEIDAELARWSCPSATRRP